MTSVEKERIDKEADSRAKKWLEVQHTCAKTEYIAGATSEHDKARNQAIEECIEILLDELEDKSNTREEIRECSSTIKRMEQLKNKP